jgi:hypothetical protein
MEEKALGTFAGVLLKIYISQCSLTKCARRLMGSRLSSPIATRHAVKSIDALHCLQVRTFIDGTLGMGGHALSICESHTATLEMLLGIDQDPDALQLAAQVCHHPLGGSSFWTRRAQVHLRCCF